MGKRRNKNSSEIADIWQLIYFSAYHFFSVLKNFWLCWVFTACWFSSSCGEWGLLSNCGARASHRSFCSCFRSQALGCAGVNSCGSWFLAHRLNSCGTQAQLLRGMWDLPASGIKLSPELARGFFTILSHKGNHGIPFLCEPILYIKWSGSHSVTSDSAAPWSVACQVSCTADLYHLSYLGRLLHIR